MIKKYTKKSVLKLKKQKKFFLILTFAIALVISLTVIIYNKSNNVITSMSEIIISNAYKLNADDKLTEVEINVYFLENSDVEEEEEETEEEIAARIEEERIEEIKNIIYFYADVYSLDQQIIYEIISDETNSFTSEDFYNLIINDMIVKNRNYTAYTVEELFIITIRDIYYNSSDYGYIFSEIYTGIEYITDLSETEQIGVLSDIFNIDKYTLYGITAYETGIFESSLYINKNNPGGIKFSGEWASFPSTYAGFIESALIIHGYTVIDGLSTLGEIGAKYALQEGEDSSWANNVRYYMEKAYDSEDDFFLDEDECLEYINKLYAGEL